MCNVKELHKVVLNTGVQTLSHKCLTDCPWDLLTVIQNARQTGNCLQHNWNGSSPFEGSNFIQGMNAVCPAYSPPRMHTSRTWEEARVRITWVPLHCPFDGSIFQRIIMGALIDVHMFCPHKSENLNISLNFVNTLMVSCHMHLQGLYSNLLTFRDL